eukprot:350699-Chlamydomonas_euryale.AAC.8
MCEQWHFTTGLEGFGWQSEVVIAAACQPSLMHVGKVSAQQPRKRCRQSASTGLCDPSRKTGRVLDLQAAWPGTPGLGYVDVASTRKSAKRTQTRRTADILDMLQSSCHKNLFWVATICFPKTQPATEMTTNGGGEKVSWFSFEYGHRRCVHTTDCRHASLHASRSAAARGTSSHTSELQRRVWVPKRRLLATVLMSRGCSTTQYAHSSPHSRHQTRAVAREQRLFRHVTPVQLRRVQNNGRAHRRRLQQHSDVAARRQRKAHVHEHLRVIGKETCAGGKVWAQV